MKLRDSGMPDESYWESLFDTGQIVSRLGIGSDLGDVAEFGSGYGTFTLPVARAIAGTIFTFDIDPAMTARTQERARAAGLVNVVCQQRDVVADGFGLPCGSMDAVLLFNILHCEDPLALLRHAADVLRPGGSLLVIHWRYDARAPRGPDLSIRPKPEQIVEWAEATREFALVGTVIDLPPWHYGLGFRKVGAS